MRDMLRRAGELFRSDREEKEIAPLRRRLEELNEQMESGDFSVENEYEEILGKVFDLERAGGNLGSHNVSPEWTQLMQALGEYPDKLKDPNQSRPPVNLRLIIDAMKRVERADEEYETEGESKAAK